MAIIVLADSHLQSLVVAIWNCFSTSDHSRLACETYGRPSSPETRFSKYFPRLLRSLLADATLQNSCLRGSFTHVAALQVQAAGGGHFRSRIAGKWFPDETPNGDFQ
jgi:hypothetical protein